MTPNFSLSLLDVFSYLFPGLILVLPYFFGETAYTQEWKLSVFDKYILVVVFGYVIGHLITLISSLIPKFLSAIRKLFKIKNSPEREILIEKLKNEVKKTFDLEINHWSLFNFCFRLVSDNCSAANEYISRIYSMALFSRNMIITSLVFVFYFGIQKIELALASLVTNGASLQFNKNNRLEKCLFQKIGIIALKPAKNQILSS